MRAHVIENGKVKNTIVVHSLDAIPGLISAENGGTIGDLYDPATGTFTTPEYIEPVPQSVTPRQFRKALKAGGLLTDIKNYMKNLPEDDALLIDWEYASEFRRDYPSVAAMAALLGKSDADIDELFKAAGKIT